MSNKITAKKILQKWQVDLAEKNKSWANIQTNFDELLFSWEQVGIECDDAHNLFPEAIKAHLPSIRIAKAAYSKSTSAKLTTLEEFVKDWNKGIADKAWQVFYLYYRVDENKNEVVKNTSIESKYGSMSIQEYSKQRKYADAYEVIDPNTINHNPIDISELEKAMESISDGPDLDLEDL